MIYLSEFPVCPRCGSENYTDSYGSNSKCEYQRCFDCGYTRQYKMIKFNGEFSYTNIDETVDIAKAIYAGEESISANPFGAYKIKRNDGNGVNGTLETKKNYENFVSEIDYGTKHKHNIKTATVSMLIDGKIVKEVLFPKPE